jgi:hypothetical protein
MARLVKHPCSGYRPKKLPSSQVMAVILPISHWRCAKHTLSFVQQAVLHEA